MKNGDIKENKGIALWKLLYLMGTCIAIVVLCSSYFNGLRFGNRFCVDIAMLSILVVTVYSLYDLTGRYMLFCFNLCYFIFLIGGLWITAFMGGNLTLYLSVSPLAARHTCHCLAISILIVNLICVILTPASKGTKRQEGEPLSQPNHKPMSQIMRQIILLVFIVALIGKFGGALIQYNFLSEYTYIDSYVMTYSKPAYIWIPESIFYFALCLWLATTPSKKQFILLFLVVTIIEVLILFSGDRGEPMTAMLMLAYYIYSRSRRDPAFIRITKGRVALILLLIPVSIFLLQMVKYTRIGQSVTPDAKFFLEFFTDQGGSAVIIGHGYDKMDTIRNIGGSSYTFGSLRGYLESNLISRWLFGTKAISQNTIAAATSGDSYGSTMAYILFPSTYLKGVGCGTSYIAELFHDGGLWQMMIGSGVLGLFLSWLSRCLQHTRGVYSTAFLLLIMKNIMMIPRTNTFGWLSSTFSVQNLLALLVLVILGNLFAEREKKGALI